MNRLRELLALLTERTLNADEQTEFTALLAEISADELAEVRGVLDQRVEDAAEDDSPAGLDLLRAVHPLMTAVNDAQAAADAAAAEAEAERQRLLSEIRGSETEPEQPAEEPASAEEPTAPAEPVPADAPAEPEAVAASASTRPVTRPRLAGARGPRSRGHRPDDASEDVSIVVGGRKVSSWREAYAAAGRELSAFGPVAQGEPTRNIGIIHVERNVDPSQVLRSGMSLPSAREMREALADGNGRDVTNETLRAITAAGGFSAPGTPLYDINNISVDDRPINDGLPKFQATRGQVLYRKATSMGDSYTSGVGVWNATTDASSGALAGTPTVTKNIVRVTIPGVTTAGIEAITTRLLVGNLIDRTDPELVEFALARVQAEQARAAENEYINDLVAAADHFTTTAQSHGAADGVCAAFDQAVASYEWRNRTGENTLKTVLLPVWAKDLLRADIARQAATAQGPVSPFEISDAIVEEFLRVRGLDPIWHLDGVHETWSQAAGTNGSPSTLAAFPTTLHFWLFAKGTVVLLDGGTLDLGIVRDSVLNQTNDMQFFAETFQRAVNLGPDVTQVTITSLAASGIRSAPA